MTGLQVLNAVIIAAGAALGLVLGVVCIIYLFYLAEVPRLQAEFGVLVLLSAAFWAVAASAALAWFGQRKQASWRWFAQALPTLPVAAIVAYLWPAS